MCIAMLRVTIYSVYKYLVSIQYLNFIENELKLILKQYDIKI